MITVKGFKYEKSKKPYVKRGVKSNYVPFGASYGGNGSFMMSPKAPKVIFLLEDDWIPNKRDFYWFIKNHSNQNVTRNYCQDIYNNLEGKHFASIDDFEKEIILNCI